MAIAAALDILLVARCRQISTDPTLRINTHDINHALNYIFLEPTNSQYRQTRVIGGRSSKNWNNLQDAINILQPTLRATNQFLIILSASNRVEDWYT